MLNLFGYQETDQIYAGSRTLVYRAIKTTTEQPVIIKVLRNPYPSIHDLVRFRNQYIITRNLEHPTIVQPLTLERYQNGYALVMPDEGALSLLEYWQDSPGNLSEFLSIALQLASALHYLGQQRIIHKDIKPSNILIHPETHQIQLIDFSISSLLPKEQQQLVNPNVLEGTLAYISPEQTGRMNRGIDYRTDFYSLGVTLYELLTEVLPFQSNDPVELLHCHIAKAPLAPSELLDTQGNLYPEAISQIILKLMAKNAEERYQSALGLQHDLERCLQQWEATEKITSFELGENDRSDRFLIPEKLYGREHEVAQLLAAFDRVAAGNSEMMLVAGFSGIGKTAVVNEIHKPIVRQRGYFIKGKFDQLNRNLPFSAFVQAFRDLMGQLLSESDTDLANWKAKILATVGENGQVLIEVIPELERIIGKQPPALELSGSAAQNRFNLLSQKFIALFSTAEHPLVMFLDDLQWADSASLKLMKALMGTHNTGYLLILGAYRDNEVFPTHPLMLGLGELEKQQTMVSTITLQPLAVDHINQLVAQTLSCPEELAEPLTELVYQKTQGNPFFTTQFLKGLHADELITFNLSLGYWQCDLVQVQDAALTDDVVVFMAERLQKLPEVSQTALKLAACIGNQFELDTLAVVSEKSSEEIATEIWGALQEGLILPITETYKFFQGGVEATNAPSVTVTYRFLHDRVQQAAYSLIPEHQKQATHLKIGQLLWHNTPAIHREEKIFDIVNQLNIGIELISEQTQRNQLAELNLIAGCKAKAATAYEAALNYLTLGMELLPPQSWVCEYDLTLNIHTLATEAAFLSGDFQRQEELGAIVMQSAHKLLDRVKIYEVKIQASQAQGELLEAIAIALEVLTLLGVEFPSQPTHADIELGLEEIKLALAGKTEAELIALPAMSDPEKLAAMKILASVMGAAYGAAFELMALMGFKLVDFSIKYGNTAESAFGYAIYGVILCELVEDFEGGYQASQLALILFERLQDNSLKAQIFVFVYDLIRHWKEHTRQILAPLLEGYSSGLETGDWEWATFSALIYCYHAYFIGQELSGLAKEMANYSQTITNLKQKAALNYQEISRQAVLNLLGHSEDSCQLIGTAYDEEKMLPLHQEAGDRTAVCFLALNKLILCNYFGNYALAQSTALLAREYLDGATGAIHWPIFHFHDSLTQLALFEEGSPEQQNQILSQIDTNQNKLHQWANFGPMNHLHKFHLVAAERHRVLGEKLAAVEMYEQAITGAKTNQYIQEEALANELIAKFYLDWGKEKIAAIYMQEAYYCYARWGAKAKTDQLEAKYPQLLSSILQQQRVEFSPLKSLDSLTQKLTASSQTSSRNSSSSISELLDFTSIFQAAQTLSSTIELEQLLEDIVRILLTNAGAQKSVLLIPQAEQWQLLSLAQLSEDGTVDTSRRSQLLTAESSVPIRVIQYVKNTREIVLIDEGKTEISGIIEGYLLKYQPQSVLCVPLLNQGQLVAIVYLEHATTKGVFTPHRLTIIQFLCAQAAVSLQNAQLYHQSQQALQDLKQAQLQLVQSEKMSSLGNLVAGVAHEINNPIGFLQGNIQPAQDYVQDLLGLIELYQKKMPNPDAEIDAEIEAIDLWFIREDLPKLLGSMHLGVKQIRNLSHSLRIFSRQEQDEKVNFNIHQGIDSTLVILKHRIKANNQRPKIEVVKDYQEIPEVRCFPSQLNQVFMNILANAIESFDETNQGLTYGEIETKPNRIIIRTRILNGTHLKIEIKDNGCGIKPEMKTRIFEQGFTTKEVGKGTGLGMALAYQIITEKHGGTITCDSTAGQGTTFTIVLPISG